MRGGLEVLVEFLGSRFGLSCVWVVSSYASVSISNYFLIFWSVTHRRQLLCGFWSMTSTDTGLQLFLDLWIKMTWFYEPHDLGADYMIIKNMLRHLVPSLCTNLLLHLTLERWPITVFNHTWTTCPPQVPIVYFGSVSLYFSVTSGGDMFFIHSYTWLTISASCSLSKLPSLITSIICTFCDKHWRLGW